MYCQDFSSQYFLSSPGCDYWLNEMLPMLGEVVYPGKHMFFGSGLIWYCVNSSWNSCGCMLFFFKFQSYEEGDKNLWHRRHHNLIKCLDIRLKTVVLNNYRGIKSQVNFATFFVLNAKMLESMTFECQRDSVTDRFLAEQHLLLQLEKRASRCARVYFTTKRCEHDFMHINHVHDLSKTDPFECEEKGAGVCASSE